jgi:hypothetical protein
MVKPSKVAAIATAAILALTPTAALAAKKPPGARSTCAALHKKEGTKRFDARYGTGKKHSGAMARCIRLHTKKSSSKKS